MAKHPKSAKPSVTQDETELADLNLAKRRTTTVIEDNIPSPNADPSLLDPQQGDPADGEYMVPDEVNTVLAELGESEHKVTLSRLNKEGKRYALLDSWPHKDFSLDMVGDMYGGGKYRIVITDPTGHYMGSKVFEIDAAKKPKDQAPAIPAIPPGYVPAAAQDNTKIYELLMAQQDRSNQQTIAMMSKLMETMALTNQPKENLFKNVQDVIAVMKLTENKPDPSVSQMNGVIDALKKGLELGQRVAVAENAPAGDGEGFLGMLLNKLLPAISGNPSVIAAISNTLTSAMTPAAPQRPQIPTDSAVSPQYQQRPADKQPPPVPGLTSPGTPVAPLSDTTIMENNNMDDTDRMFQQVKSHFFFSLYNPVLLEKARTNADVEKTAGMVLLSIPETSYAPLAAIINRPGFIDKMTKNLPEYASYKPWLTELVTRLLADITEYFSADLTDDTDAAVVETPEAVTDKK